jgi:capsular polysaccharide biosynthesis protein
MPHVYILPDTGGYLYHFLILELSLLRNLKKFEYEDNIFIHMPHLKKYNQQYMYEAIKYFEPEIILLDNIDNIPKYNIIEIKEHEPLINEDRNMVSNEAILYLRNVFLKNKDYKLDKNKFIYITREGSELLSNNQNIHPIKRRQILNEKELYEPLKKLGFQIIKLQDYSFEEKEEMFQTSSLIVGPEGGNLTCSILAKKETRIISICYKSSYIEHTQHIAKAVGIELIKYENVERVKVIEDQSNMSDNMIINTEHFISFIQNILNTYFH